MLIVEVAGQVPVVDLQSAEYAGPTDMSGDGGI
jgi:hypothetical protein